MNIMMKNVILMSMISVLCAGCGGIVLPLDKLLPLLLIEEQPTRPEDHPHSDPENNETYLIASAKKHQPLLVTDLSDVQLTSEEHLICVQPITVQLAYVSPEKTVVNLSVVND